MKAFIYSVVSLFTLTMILGVMVARPRAAKGSPPGQAPAAQADVPPPKKQLRDAEHVVEMLTSNRKNQIIGDEWIRIHFTARHKAQVAGPYQFVVTAYTFPSGEVVARHAFGRYVLAAGEERQDEFAKALEVPPGEYVVELELRSLYPVVDPQGNKIRDYLGQGNHIYRAVVQ